MHEMEMLAAALAVSMAHENLERGIKAVSTSTLTYNPKSSDPTPVDAICTLGNAFASYVMAVTSYGILADQQDSAEHKAAPPNN